MHKPIHDIKIILNPAAAKGKAGRAGPRIRKIMDSYNVSYDLVVTKEIWHAARVAEEAAKQGYAVVVAAGGDGTCNEVINGLMAYNRADGGQKMETAFAVFPIGRGNDFAYSLGVPSSLDEAIRLLLDGKSKRIDIAKVCGGDYPEGRYFVNGLGIGFEPLVNLTASRYKRISGVLSYVIAVIQIMKNYPEAIPVLLQYGDKDAVVSVNTQQISICNGRRMGGAFLLGPDAELDDGQLDLCYVNRPVSGSKILYLVTRFFRGTQKSHEFVSSDLVGDILVKTQNGGKGLICHIDGEMITTGVGTDQLSIHLYPQALSVFFK
ncbi:MAG: diacylglycerol kinase family lipid kinase [Bacteroidetes bacterium]|nr:diacylglycerol kinase family lipid kinase [Bacteroidota bacterium]